MQRGIFQSLAPRTRTLVRVLHCNINIMYHRLHWCPHSSLTREEKPAPLHQWGTYFSYIYAMPHKLRREKIAQL